MPQVFSDTDQGLALYNCQLASFIRKKRVKIGNEHLNFLLLSGGTVEIMNQAWYGNIPEYYSLS